MKTTTRTASFGPYALDLRSGELRKFGTRVKLGEQTFQILRLLLETQGELVTREELCAKLWAGDTFVDFDHGLNSAVQRLRDCLSDSAEKPRWVETVPRHGYRFVGQVEWSDQALSSDILSKPNVENYRGNNDEAQPTVGVESSPVASTGSGRRIALLLVATFFLLLAAFPFARRVRRPSPTGQDLPIRSLAVLPFANIGNSSEMDYLGNSLSEEITNSLSRLSNLQVMAHSSSSRYKAQDDLLAIGRKLHVEAILTGTAAQHGSELSVEAELVDVSSGAQLWGKRYKRNSDQALLLQTDITHDVAAILRPELAGNAQEDLARVGTSNAKAYRLYLRGRYAFESWTPESLNGAADFFERAVATDPNFASAYAGLADVYAVKGYMGYLSESDSMERARSDAHRALELDAQIPESHIALANLDLNYFWNFQEAEEEIQKALVLAPNSSYAHEVSCWIKVSTGKTQEGLAECRRSVDLDPLSGSRNVSLAFEYYWAHDYKDAIEQANKTLALGLIYPQAVLALAMTHEEMRNYKQANSDLIEFYRLSGDEARAEKLKQVDPRSGRTAYLKGAAKYLEGSGRYYYAAREYARLGDKDAAFADLEKVFANRAGARNMKVDPAFDDLRSDPRFASLLRRIGFPQ